MKVSSEKIENQQVVLTIEVEAAEFGKAIDRAAKNIAARVNVPGFRKGKAPRNILERHVGKDYLLQEAFDIASRNTFADALKEESLEPVTQPEIDAVTMEEGKDLVYKATFTQRPEVQLGEYKGLKVDKEEVSVSDDDVAHELHHMQEHHAKMVDAAEGDAVVDGDFITLDFKGYVNDEAFEGGEGKDYPLQIGSGSFIPGFEEQLVGVKVGEQKDVNVKFPEEYHAENLAGKDAKFDCTVRSIKHRELPELNDELAKKVSSFDTLDALKEDIKKNLIETREKKAENDRRTAAIEKATENTKVDIPEVMVDNRVNHMIDELRLRVEQQGLSFEQYLQFSGTDISKIKEEYRDVAAKNVKMDLMLEEVAKEEDIKVEASDLDAEVAMMAAAYGASPKDVAKIIREQGRLADLVATVQRRKTAQFIIDNLAE